MEKDLIKNSLLQARKVLDDFLSDESNLKKIEEAGDILVAMFKRGGRVFSCGNGGSLCDAMHFAEEFTGRFREDRIALPAIAIADPSHITCVGNDYGFEYIFSKYIEAHATGRDVLLAISTSGNSANINRAIEEARRKGMAVIGLTGKSGGQMKGVCDIVVVVPWNEYSDRIQEIHIKIIHILIEYVENKLFAEQ